MSLRDVVSTSLDAAARDSIHLHRAQRTARPTSFGASYRRIAGPRCRAQLRPAAPRYVPVPEPAAVDDESTIVSDDEATIVSDNEFTVLSDDECASDVDDLLDADSDMLPELSRSSVFSPGKPSPASSTTSLVSGLADMALVVRDEQEQEPTRRTRRRYSDEASPPAIDNVLVDLAARLEYLAENPEVPAPAQVSALPEAPVPAQVSAPARRARYILDLTGETDVLRLCLPKKRSPAPSINFIVIDDDDDKPNNLQSEPDCDEAAFIITRFS